MTQTPAGWFPDPQAPGLLRYWDGADWTDSTSPVVAPPAPVQQYVRHVSSGHVAIAWIIALVTLGYMIPWAVAATRNKPNTGPIAVVNLLAGWTVIGWVAALVMACMNN